MIFQTTSTVLAYALQSVNYTWDSVIGMLFTGGMLLFFSVLLILTGVITLAIRGIGKIFKR